MKKYKCKITAVIPAHNEGPRISRVLDVVIKHPLIDQVVVINDGSSDNTAEVIARYPVTFIDNEKNIGKTLSVKRGLELAINELIFMVDADLLGLDEKAITDLAQPVIDGEVDWTLSLRSNSLWHMKLLKMDWISGERVIPKKLLADPAIWSRPEVGFSLETLMNKSLLEHQTTFRSVYLPEVIVVNKSKKIGFFKGWLGEFRMFSHFLRVMPLHRILCQYFKMAFLNRRYKKTSQGLKYREV